ncbi:hypothetical protein BSL78_02968 [Apostichopus japonicus]|uniref:Ig-like domain-containing protein n=1 Tax=Stichopus japonicus TaxID=307972 RepID=A0A2G8LII2_STIJA|nr:hypothetical protein BSL78_02968 [Apostichopus japonicus]
MDQYTFDCEVTEPGRGSTELDIESNSSTLRCSAFNGLNITAENNIYVVEASYPAKVYLNSQSSLSIRPGDTVNISCTVDGNLEPDVYIQLKDTSEEWETLSLRPFEIQTYVNKTTILAFQLHVNEKVIAHQYRCIANNISELFVWSNDLILACKKDFSEVLVENMALLLPFWYNYWLLYCCIVSTQRPFERTTDASAKNGS